MHFSSSPYGLHSPSLSFTLIYHSGDIWWRVRILELFIILLSPASLLPFRSSYSLQHPVLTGGESKVIPRLKWLSTKPWKSMGVWRYSSWFLTSASRRCCCTPGTRCVRGWMGPTGRWRRKEKALAPTKGIEPRLFGRPALSVVDISTKLYAGDVTEIQPLPLQ
jgi:hypothetical protein